MKEKATAFAVGATGYPCIEILARGHTHWSMALLGGICVLALVWIARRYPGMNIAVQAALGTAFITAAELAVGLVVNRALGFPACGQTQQAEHGQAQQEPVKAEQGAYLSQHIAEFPAVIPYLPAQRPIYHQPYG